MQVWGRGIPLLEQALNATALRQRVVNENIANYETPYYKSKHVEFESILKKKLEESSSKALPMVKPIVTRAEHLVMNNNHNDVDLEYESTRLAEVQIQYNAQIQLINYQFSQLQRAIGGR